MARLCKRPMFARDARGAVGAHAACRSTCRSISLRAEQRRIVLHGTGEEWIDVYADGKPKARTQRPLFRFQYKGLYPALEEAARLSPALRGKLEHLVDEVECSTCGGSRLRDDAAAVRFRDRTIDELCRMPLGELLARVQRLEARRAASERSPASWCAKFAIGCSSWSTSGLEYLTLGRARADALRRRSAAHSPGQPGRQRPVRRAVRAR